MDQRRGYQPVPEQPTYSQDEVLEKMAKAHALVQAAEEKLRQSNGRDEYAQNIRALDVVKKEYKKWEETPFRMSVDELKMELERANRDLKHSQDQREYESAMRRIDNIQKQISNIESNNDSE